jgi:hypothetical protein
MKFSYSGFLARSPDTGEETIIFRPEVPLHIHGSGGSAIYLALVDTGADNSVFPLSIARELNIVTYDAKGPGATAFDGQHIPLSYGDVQLELSENNTSARWQARVYFYEFTRAEAETLVIGHDGFLDFFTAIFDGEHMTLDLEPNGEMPAVRSLH